MRDAIVVAFGGGLGAILRFGLQRWVQTQLPSPFPIGTLLINVIGSFLIGWWMAMGAESFRQNPAWFFFLIVGLLGGFTTFSALAWDVHQLWMSGKVLLALGYVCLTFGGGLLAVCAGFALGR